VFSQGWYNPDIKEHGYSSSMEVPRAEKPWVLFQSSQNLMRARSCWLQKLEQNQWCFRMYQNVQERGPK
jgi:hypothetical protein